MDSYSEDDYLDENDCDIMYSNHENSSGEDTFPVSFPKNVSKAKMKKRKTKAKQKEQIDSSDDEFENDMTEELKKIMKGLTKPSTSDAGRNLESASSVKQKENKKYDAVYFDSDSSEDEETGSKKSREKENKKKFQTNDELLYDPAMDDDNQAWVDATRSSYQVAQNLRAAQKAQQPQKLPHSDAVLNCPACFAILCLDCQRHAIYQNQYRAMFVFNCHTDISEILHCPVKQEKSKKRKKPDDEAPVIEAATSADEFHPVKCTQCNTKVAVYDKDEVYHFFNVLSSY